MGQGIKMKVISSKDSISIRWVPSDYSEWQKGNKYGYKIERFLVSKNEKMADVSSMTILHEGVIKPIQEMEWEPIIKKDSVYAPIALQALWGETFELSSTFKTNITELYNKVKENESRFGFAMYCADRSLIVAKALGVYFVDKRIKSDEKYIYRIYLNAPLSEALDTTYAVAIPNVSEDLAIPSKPSLLQVGDNVLLTWNASATDYVGYHIERSEDSRNYKQISKDLVVPFFEKNKILGYFSDTTIRKSGSYYYRIVGITPFQKRGPYSDTLQIRIRKHIPAPEKVESFVENGRIVLKWEYANTVKELSHFMILKSSVADGPYAIIANSIDAKKSNWKDESEYGGYYKVVAITKEGYKSESLETFAQLNDETPPIPPIGLTGTIDTLGVVRLTWNANTEKDLLGYRVFRANTLDGEFSQITKNIISQNSFTDTITIKTLTKNVYYMLAAVDKRYNSSLYSSKCKLNRPDIIKPAPPVLIQISSTPIGRKLKWIPSPSTDVHETAVYRVSDRDTTIAIKVYHQSSIEDTTSLNESSFIQYFLVAIDSAGNQSIHSNSMSFKNKTYKQEVNIELKGKIVNGNNGPEVHLEWDNTPSLRNIILYRKVGDKQFSIYKNIDNIHRFVDNKLPQGFEVSYFIRSNNNCSNVLIFNFL